MATTGSDPVRQRIETTATPLALLRATAAAQPDKPAIEFLRTPLDTTPRVVTYRALLHETEAAYRAFLAAGVERDDGIAMLLPSTPEAIITLIAAIEAGVAAPLNTLLAPEAIAAQLRLARAKVAVVLGAHPVLEVWGHLEEAARSVPSLSTVVEVPVQEGADRALTWERFLAGHRGGGPLPDVRPDPQRVAALFNSGGTTGTPKLAQLSERNLMAGTLMAAAAMGLRAEDRLLLPLPMFHVAGAIDGVLASIAVGCTIILPTHLGGRHPQLIPNIWKVIEQTCTTVAALVPTSLIAAAEVPLGDCRLHALRAVVTGSAPLLPATATRIEKLIGKPIAHVYGMTETSGITTAQPADGEFRAPAVGFPAPLLELRIDRSSDLGGAQDAARGEVRVRGPNVFVGYRTEAGTVGQSADGWLASGDIGEIDAQGQLRLFGRSKDVIIRGGHNIDPLMIEDVANSHPDIVQSIAVAMPDAYAGEVPLLFVIVRAGASVGSEAIAQYLRVRLAEPEARPKEIVLIAELPLTPIGKVARFKLRQSAAERCARAVLAGLPVASVQCVDIAAKQIDLAWQAHATPLEQQRGRSVLETLGLTVR